MKGSANAHPLDLGAVVDGLPAMVAYVDGEHRYRYVNRAYERRHGRSRDEIIGLGARERSRFGRVDLSGDLGAPAQRGSRSSSPVHDRKRGVGQIKPTDEVA